MLRGMLMRMLEWDDRTSTIHHKSAGGYGYHDYEFLSVLLSSPICI